MRWSKQTFDQLSLGRFRDLTFVHMYCTSVSMWVNLFSFKLLQPKCVCAVNSCVARPTKKDTNDDDVVVIGGGSSSDGDCGECSTIIRCRRTHVMPYGWVRKWTNSHRLWISFLLRFLLLYVSVQLVKIVYAWNEMCICIHIRRA